MDGLTAAIRQSINDHLGHREDVAALRRQMDAFCQAANLCTIQSPGGREIYATGMRPDHVHNCFVCIKLRPFMVNNQTQNCPIEQVANAEVCLWGRVVRLADASSAECRRFVPSTGLVEFGFSFAAFTEESSHGAEVVDLDVVVEYTLRPEVATQRNLATLPLTRSNRALILGSVEDEVNAATHPFSLSANDLTGTVSFSRVTICDHDDSSEYVDEDMDSEDMTSEDEED